LLNTGQWLISTSFDLAIIVGIVSSLRDEVIPHDAFFFGEIRLSGKSDRLPTVTHVSMMRRIMALKSSDSEGQCAENAG
jgi:predicted ATP-dependent serine protease